MRIIDILFSFFGILILSPFFLLLFLYYYLFEGGGFFYKQERIGRMAEPFDILKIRTMSFNSETSTVSLKNDSRVTPIGKFLRKWKIDELPQLYNILLGDMSFVGPRPTVSSDYSRMNKAQLNRSLVRPGLTGLAQISGNTSLSWPQRLRYDLIYVKNKSICLDAYIILKTAVFFIRGKLETHPNDRGEWD